MRFLFNDHIDVSRIHKYIYRATMINIYGGKTNFTENLMNNLVSIYEKKKKNWTARDERVESGGAGFDSRSR